MNQGKKNAAEFIGTFGLVFAGTGAIIINDVSGGAVTNVGIGLTFGMIVLAMIYAVGDVSGAHLNPAVTLGFFAARRLEAKMVLPYVLSQLSGAGCESAFARIISAASNIGGNCAGRSGAAVTCSRNRSHRVFDVCDSQRLRGCKRTRNHRGYRGWSSDCTGSAFCRPDFRCIDESGALLRPSISLSTSDKSVDLSCCTGHGRLDCCGRMSVRAKGLLFCSSPWHDR